MFLSEPECATLTQMLLSGVRLDGRTLKEYREINFNFPNGHPNGGCCIVNIGATSVLAKISAEVVEPKHYRPSQGVVYVNFDATAASYLDGRKRSKSRDDEGRRLSWVLQTCLRDCVDVDALCIVAWEKVFAIRVDLKALSFDGNLGDCGALAALAALASFRRPDVYVNDEGRVVVDVEMRHRPPVRLNLRRVPVLVSLGLISGDAKVVLLDPTQREEALLKGGRVLVGLTSHGELCCLHTSGLTTPIQPASLTKCINIATSRAKALVALLNRVLNGLERQRAVLAAQSMARHSDLDRANQMLQDVPLVLSSTAFIDSGSGQCEEGEVVSDDDGDAETGPHRMEIEGESDEEQKKEPLTPRDPYGVIEVSSALAAKEKPEEAQTMGENWGVLSIESDETAISRALKSRGEGVRKRPRLMVVEEEKAGNDGSSDDEEEEVTVNLL